MKKLIAYYRVSTQQQGQSGLGLEAQQATVTNYARLHGLELAGAFIEVESGRKNDRPQLKAALAACEAQGAALIVAKLDRLGRRVSTLSKLLESKVHEFVFCDMPQVSGAMGRFILLSMANVAELEAGLISERTKAALAAARERGVCLGSPTTPQLHKNAAMARAESLRAIFAEHAGKSARAMAEVLNQAGVATPTGAPWSAKAVWRVKERLAA
jgi:DNA invertase Pin-like site-specific DNA recombinase